MDITREENTQMSLFPNERKARLRKVDQTVDHLRGRFGADAIVRGSAMHSTLRVGKKYQAQLELARQEGAEPAAGNEGRSHANGAGQLGSPP